jgi:hypothetical protein
MSDIKDNSENSELMESWECPVGYDCYWDAKYGLVPEAGCPLHDPEES